MGGKAYASRSVGIGARPPFSKPIKALAAAVLGVVALAQGAGAQDFNALKQPDSPLTLRARGSFYVGGTVASQTATQLGDLGPDDRIAVNQMYVEYMIPETQGKVPVIMIHGATLSGKTWDTTPDGRMGWFEYFVRQGHPVYVPDQVGRARSGFDQKIFNDVRAGLADKASLPSIMRLGDNYGAWTNFRIGPKPGEPFPDTQFPIEAVAEFSKQSIPDLFRLLPNPNPTFKALSDLAIRIGGAVLMGHSQAGRFPTESALIDPKGLKALILLEPGACNAPFGTTYTDEQVAKLAKLPILVVFGDHLSSPTGLPGASWQERLEDCELFARRINAANGRGDVLHLPREKIYGNTHMMMQDKNSIVVADKILEWIDKNAR